MAELHRKGVSNVNYQSALDVRWAVETRGIILTDQYDDCGLAGVPVSNLVLSAKIWESSPELTVMTSVLMAIVQPN